MEQDNKVSGESLVETKNAKKNKKKKSKKIKKFIIWGVVLAVVVGFFFLNSGGANSAGNIGVVYNTATVSRNDISVTLTGTGTLQPADKYTVTSLITGEILTDDFEEGDVIEEDTILYTVDNSDAENALEKSELLLSQSRSSYDRLLESLTDLNIKADNAGTIVDIFVEIGDEVQPGQNIATVINNSVMSIELPFSSNDVDGFYVGQEASVTVESTYETITGVISEIKNVEEAINGNKLVKKVTIDVQNPGGISVTDSATASINNIACVEKSTFSYKDQENITAKLAGEVVSIPLAEGDWINSNQTIAVLQSDTLEDNIETSESNLKDAELSLENQQDLVDEYSIKSPISGTVIEKEYKSGDNLEPGKVLCTIFDLSHLTMTLNVDELDIFKISEGQEVTITADAAENKTFKGEVTKISINGTTMNGVTSYPVTIQIDNSEGLLPGMNVDATIEIQNKEDVVSIPIEAVERGNIVLVKTNGTVQSEQLKESTVPGYEYVSVELGISNEDIVEITSGLNEGDEIAIIGRYTNLMTEVETQMMTGPGGPPTGGRP